MNALRRKTIECGLVDELRLCAGGKAPTMSELRRQIDCTAAELSEVIQALRFQGKLSWDTLALSPSMLAGAVAREGTAGALPAAEGGAEPVSVEVPPSGPDDPERDYPGEVNDKSEPIGKPAPAAPVSTFGHRGRHAAQTRAANKPVPPPRHELEVERQVREEANETVGRRQLGRSTATVRQPLELRKFGVPDLSFAEGVHSLLAETPQDLMRAIERKHVATWRRIILLSRTRGERPAQSLYAVLEAGLASLEPTNTDEKAAA
jgi:hypothetical protein